MGLATWVIWAAIKPSNDISIPYAEASRDYVLRPRPQPADMWKISTSLKQPYNVGNIFSDNIHVHWSYVRSIYMVVI